VGIWHATFARTAHAHDPFEITAVVRLGADALTVQVTMARSTALALATGRHDPRTKFDPHEFSTHRARIDELAPSLYELRSDGRRLRFRAAASKLTDESDVEVTATYERPAAARLSLRASHLSILPEGYTSALSLLEVGTESAHFKLLTRADPVFEIRLADARNATESPEPTISERFRRFVALGAQHVLTGYDHLLFLFGVLVACRTLRAMLAVITSFTLAHSLTLGLAVFGHASVSATIVEPLIAASIVYVGIENVLGKEALGRRVAVTFAFGLVHGLGFAGALADLALEDRGLPLALFSFNLGIELGQLAVAAVALPLLSTLHATERGTRSLRIASVLVSLMGCFWLIERVV
jgi:hydrogenase/urease accessory protein HupE